MAVKTNQILEKRNVAIQLLRVSACVMVFLVHFGQRVDFWGGLRKLTEFGQYGVQLFFLLSGYLAAMTLVKKSVNLREYYRKRCIAILPLYVLVIFWYFVTENVLDYLGVGSIPADELGLEWLRYIFLLNGMLNSDTYFWSNLGITWTIPIFVCFYLLAPWLLKMVKGVFSAVLLWGMVLVVSQMIGKVYTCSIQRELHIFFLGVVVYACVLNRRQKVGEVIFLLAAVVMVIFGRTVAAYVAIFTCLILLLLEVEDNIKMPDRVKEAVVILDEYSYTLYLMHGVIFCSLLDRLKNLGVNRIIIAILAVIGTAATTFIVGKFIEKPIQGMLKRKLLK